MPVLEVQQQSIEWLRLRVGKCTGSRVKDALSFLKNGQPSQKRKDYMVDIVTERLTGIATDHYITEAMQFGSDNEVYARAAYSVISGNEVDSVGICVHPTIKDFQSSPDGLVNGNGVVEFKVPNTATHIEWKLDGIIPKEHEYQMMAHLACSGREYCDFLSFDPRLPPKHQYFLKRMERFHVEDLIVEMEAGVIQFLSEVDEMIAKMEAK
jgi:predicted phage-related endonuclease